MQVSIVQKVDEVGARLWHSAWKSIWNIAQKIGFTKFLILNPNKKGVGDWQSLHKLNIDLVLIKFLDQCCRRANVYRVVHHAVNPFHQHRN